MSVLVIQDDEDDGRGAVVALRPLDQRKWPMLECAAAVPLGVDVRHLLQLQGTLLTHRESARGGAAKLTWA